MRKFPRQQLESLIPKCYLTYTSWHSLWNCRTQQRIWMLFSLWWIATFNHDSLHAIAISYKHHYLHFRQTVCISGKHWIIETKSKFWIHCSLYWRYGKFTSFYLHLSSNLSIFHCFSVTSTILLLAFKFILQISSRGSFHFCFQCNIQLLFPLKFFWCIYLS